MEKKLVWMKRIVHITIQKLQLILKILFTVDKNSQYCYCKLVYFELHLPCCLSVLILETISIFVTGDNVSSYQDRFCCPEGGSPRAGSK